MLADDHDFAAKLAVSVIDKIVDRFAYLPEGSDEWIIPPRAAHVANSVVSRIETALIKEN